MPFSGFGCSVAEPHKLGEVLAAIADAGFTHAEIRPRDWDLWGDGAVNRRELARYSSVLERFACRLSYTLHAPYDLNLFDSDERQATMLQASVEVAATVGAEVIVVHPGRLERYGSNWSAPMAELMARERGALLEVADQMSSWHGSLAIETWFAVGNVAHSYAVWPAQLAKQVDLIAHPRIGVCLDTGHLQLAARWFGFDVGEAVRMLSPLVAHTHVHDNFGVLAPVGSNELGHGDMHVPPSWGERSLGMALTGANFGRSPVFNVEVAGQYLPHLENILAECRRLAACETEAGVPPPPDALPRGNGTGPVPDKSPHSEGAMGEVRSAEQATGFVED